MPSRIIREGINSSKRINQLSPLAELFYRRLMTVADDYGRYYGSPATVRCGCWPTCPDKVTDQQIVEWMDECCAGDEPLILRYDTEDAKYLQITNFRQQTRSKSKFPDCLSIAKQVRSTGEANAQPSRISYSDSFICASGDAQASDGDLKTEPEPAKPVVAQPVNGKAEPKIALVTGRDESTDNDVVNGKYNAAHVFQSEFWPLRWRPQGKAGALKAFIHHAKTRERADRIIAALKSQREYYLTRDSSMRPYMSTWLNERLYEDELVEIPPKIETESASLRDYWVDDLAGLVESEQSPPPPEPQRAQFNRTRSAAAGEFNETSRSAGYRRFTRVAVQRTTDLRGHPEALRRFLGSPLGVDRCGLLD